MVEQNLGPKLMKKKRHVMSGRLLRRFDSCRAASLRNIALTAPYMHDGRFATLREVIDHYDHGIVASANLDSILKDATGAPRRMNLSDADKAALEAFLNTFTDAPMLADPKFMDPFP